MNTKRITKTKPSRPKFQAQVGAKNLVGLQIRLFREKRQWTQHQLAESFKKAGVLITRNMIASIETQRCVVTDYQIIFFARVLGVSWRSLFPKKSILEKLTPPPALKKESVSASDSRTRHPVGNSTGVSEKRWSLCKMTCKSLKITFRSPA